MAAGWRYVGEDLAAAASHKLSESPSLSSDLGHRDSATFMTVLDSSIVNITACAGGIKVKRQHPAGARGGIEDRHRARLAGRLLGQRPGMTGRVGAAAVARDPDVLSTVDRGRDRPSRGRCEDGARS